MDHTSTYIDRVRVETSAKLDRRQRSQLGQFMTPSSIATFMASLFPEGDDGQTARLLDAGAGIGSLTCAFIERWAEGRFSFSDIEVTAYEIDEAVREQLRVVLDEYAVRRGVNVTVKAKDFVDDAVFAIQFQASTRFSHVILNPPYRKIGSHSAQRLMLRKVGIETVNLYSAFVALAIELLEDGGHVVAIIPRSFCNGPYYRPFRDLLLKQTAIKHLHLFDSRRKAFGDDGVLQENIIVALQKGVNQGEVIVSTSTDGSFSDYEERCRPFVGIVRPDDPEHFIHVPTSTKREWDRLPTSFSYSLEDLGIEVSTGPVVDFRLREHVRNMPVAGSVPLLYPAHLVEFQIQWPVPAPRKPNALMHNAVTEKWLYPNGHYAVVRRFSSKEERRRVVAGVVMPQALDCSHIGFENHLNVYHAAKQGLPEELARGLTVFLNCTMLDQYFRSFSGHTQVNATDLRLLPYPSREVLMQLGRWAAGRSTLSIVDIDAKIGEYV